jgi:hypothetical protein
MSREHVQVRKQRWQQQQPLKGAWKQLLSQHAHMADLKISLKPLPTLVPCFLAVTRRSWVASRC